MKVSRSSLLSKSERLSDSAGSTEVNSAQKFATGGSLAIGTQTNDSEKILDTNVTLIKPQDAIKKPEDYKKFMYKGHIF